jgi:choline dehydrogenase-like flavoprotein
MDPNSYDVVIVGAGVAGALCACRIKEAKPQARVLLLDAGGVADAHHAGDPLFEPVLQVLAVDLGAGDVESVALVGEGDSVGGVGECSCCIRAQVWAKRGAGGAGTVTGVPSIGPMPARAARTSSSP